MNSLKLKFFDHSPDAICVLNAKLDYVVVNKKWKELWQDFPIKNIISSNSVTALEKSLSETRELSKTLEKAFEFNGSSYHCTVIFDEEEANWFIQAREVETSGFREDLIHNTNRIGKLGHWTLDLKNKTFTWCKELFSLHEL